jgi:hypothetical protein
MVRLGQGFTAFQVYHRQTETYDLTLWIHANALRRAEQIFIQQ